MTIKIESGIVSIKAKNNRFVVFGEMNGEVLVVKPKTKEIKDFWLPATFVDNQLFKRLIVIKGDDTYVMDIHDILKFRGETNAFYIPYDAFDKR